MDLIRVISSAPEQVTSQIWAYLSIVPRNGILIFNKIWSIIRCGSDEKLCLRMSRERIINNERKNDTCTHAVKVELTASFGLSFSAALLKVELPALLGLSFSAAFLINPSYLLIFSLFDSNSFCPRTVRAPIANKCSLLLITLRSLFISSDV